MPRKNTRNTKGRIIAAAWKLFYEQGYEETTVEDIVFESETSKGSFYHYFEGKDALMGTLAYVFDEKYEELMEVMDPNLGAMEKLIYLNHELFAMIDGSVSMDLLARLLSTQLLARGEKHLLDRNRYLFQAAAPDHRRGAADRASCGGTGRSMRSSRPTPCGSGPCCTTGACAAGNIPWWPIQTVSPPCFWRAIGQQRVGNLEILLFER